MKQATDKFTSEMFGNRVGRPPKVNTMSAAERQRKRRATLKTAITAALMPALISVTSHEKSTPKTCDWCGQSTEQHCGICMTGQLGQR